MPRLVRVAFDYDGTLTEPEVRSYAENLKERGFNIWIVTARLERQSEQVYKAAREMKVNKEHVIFTNLQYKYTFLNDIRPIFHLDDDWIESNLIKVRSKNVVSVQYAFNPDWMEECEEALIGYKDRDGFALTPRVQAKKKRNKPNRYET